MANIDILGAAKAGLLELVCQELKTGVPVDTTDKDGNTALIWASAYGYEEVVNVLLKRGATVDMQAKDGWTALMSASSHNHPEIVEKLLAAGAQPDHQRSDGRTALSIASLKGHVEVVEAIVKAGATVDMQEKNGFTSLMNACQEGHKRIVETLLKGGARVDMHKEDGWTALMSASSHNHPEVVEKLLAAGAQPDHQTSDGWTALMFASIDNHPEVVEKLLAAGAQPDHQNSDGDTALTVASFKGHAEIVEVLVNAGATVDMQKKDGSTALSLARMRGHLRVVELLQRASTQPHKKEQQKVGSADGPRAAAATEHQNGEGPVLKVEPDGRPSAHKPLSGHSKPELQVQCSKEDKPGEMTVLALQRRCTTLEHQLKQEQLVKQRIQEHSEQVVQDMTTAQLQQQLAQEKREAIQTKQQLEQQLQQQATEIQQLQQRLDSATTDNQHLQHDNQQLQQRLTSAIADNQQLQHDKQQLQQRLTSATTNNQQLQQRLTHASAELQSLQDIEPWKISRNKVEIQARIGEGGWGSVSQGTVRVAVKKLHDLLLSQHNVDRVQREMRMLAQVRHPNLVQFIGVVFDEAALRLQASPMIITELLEMNLRTAYERKLEFNKLSIFLDVARAMKYLHTRQEPLIHRDISAPNVLLEALPNHVWKGKVSDLGSANLAKLAHTLGEGAIIYAAPETMPQAAHRPRAPKPRQTTKVDVYSFGVLLCEVGTSQFPDPDHYQDMLEQVQREWPALHELIVSCTQENPDERPTMPEVHARLSHTSH